MLRVLFRCDGTAFARASALPAENRPYQRVFRSAGRVHTHLPAVAKGAELAQLRVVETFERDSAYPFSSRFKYGVRRVHG